MIAQNTARLLKINFSFVEFDLEHHDTCDADRLIFTLPAVGDGVIYNTVCGSTAPPPFSIPSYEAGVIFQSDDLGHGKFNMSYAVKECGGLIIDQLQGVVASPNYPQVRRGLFNPQKWAVESSF